MLQVVLADGKSGPKGKVTSPVPQLRRQCDGPGLAWTLWPWPPKIHVLKEASFQENPQISRKGRERWLQALGARPMSLQREGVCQSEYC